MTYTGPERRQSARWKVLTEEEIDLYLKGERRDIDRLILCALNRLAESSEQQIEKLNRHQIQEDEMLAQVTKIGGFDAIKKRADFTDTAIRKLEEETKLIQAAKNKVVLGGVGALVFALVCLIVYFWNGHMPSSAQIPMPKP